MWLATGMVGGGGRERERERVGQCSVSGGHNLAGGPIPTWGPDPHRSPACEQRRSAPMAGFEGSGGEGGLSPE